MTESHFRQAFLLLLVTAISAAFVAMIRAFLLTILLAAIFAGLSYPAYEWLLGRLRGRKALAAIATLLLLVLVMVPLLAALGAGANEALRVTETVRPRLQQLVDQPGEFNSGLRALLATTASNPTGHRFSRRPASSSAAPARSSLPHSLPQLGRRRFSSFIPLSCSTRCSSS